MSGAVLVASPFIFLKQPLAAMAAAVMLALLVIAIQAFAKDRNALVRQLQEARLLAETNSDAKLRFLALVSPEIRTPLSGISGVADLLSTTNLDSRQNRLIRLMQSSSAVLSRIVDDVLLATKGLEARLSLSPAPYDLASTVQQIAEQFARRAQDSGADFAKCPACHAATEARTGTRHMTS